MRNHLKPKGLWHIIMDDEPDEPNEDMREDEFALAEMQLAKWRSDNGREFKVTCASLSVTQNLLFYVMELGLAKAIWITLRQRLR